MMINTSAAQDVWWLVTRGIPQSELLEVREAVRTELSQRDVRVLESARAQELFETEISVPPTFVSQTQINEWAERSRSALSNLANADYEQAREDLLQAQALSERAADELNRETDRAREVLDTCLYMVRAFVETGDQTRATQQARECRRLVPQIEPSRFRHPPEVREILEQLDDERSRTPAAVLRVQSTPSNCVVRLNGIQVGRTPFAMADLARGEYRLQVECGETRGRVRRVRLDDEVTQVTIDTVFDQEMHSRPVYVEDNARADAHVAALAAQLERTVVLVARDSDGYRLTRFERDWRSSSDRFGANDAAAAVAQIVGAEAPEGGGTTTPVRSRPSGPPLPTWRRNVGIVLGVAGFAILAGGIGLHLPREGRGETYSTATVDDPDYLVLQNRWQDLRSPMIALSMIGGAVLGASAAAWMPEREGVHWASWVSGVTGLGLAAGAFALTFSRDECPSITGTEDEVIQCVAREKRGGQAALLGGAGLGLIMIPIIDLLRRPGGDSVAMSPVIDRDQYGLVLEGRF